MGTKKSDLSIEDPDWECFWLQLIGAIFFTCCLFSHFGKLPEVVAFFAPLVGVGISLAAIVRAVHSLLLRQRWFLVYFAVSLINGIWPVVYYAKYYDFILFK